MYRTELRWIVPMGTTTSSPKLQVRETQGDGWSKWKDVPIVGVSNEEYGIRSTLSIFKDILTPSESSTKGESHEL